MIKVGVIGTHGTGKTVICHELVSELGKLSIPVDYVGETAREVPNGLVINEGTTRETQEWILHTQIAKELAAKREAVVICDRATIDNYAYLQRQSGGNLIYDAMIRHHLPSYSLLLKVPIKPEYLTADGVRSINRFFQAEIDSILEKTLTEWNVPFTHYTTKEDAIDRIMNLLEEQKK
ncbi:MAG: AAA family ATPase [Candidatus Pacearchaeota archaeon]|jgi:nicotinamide riboside kinase